LFQNPLDKPNARTSNIRERLETGRVGVQMVYRSRALSSPYLVKLATGTKGRRLLCSVDRSVGHHVPGTLVVGLELRETYRGAIGAADLDLESPAGFALDGVGVIDGPQIPCLDAKLRDGQWSLLGRRVGAVVPTEGAMGARDRRV
jgi:hypothetical protein